MLLVAAFASGFLVGAIINLCKRLGLTNCQDDS